MFLWSLMPLLGLLVTNIYGLAFVDMSIDILEDKNHPCFRNCSLDPQPKVCAYKFKVEWYTTLSKACYNCVSRDRDCLKEHCVAADGRKKPIVTVNRRLPGPSLQVCQGDEVIVDLSNELKSDTTAIHWHGMHMVGTPYMDGVPHLTQCPIQPESTFRYHFLADKTGTHYWHSHAGFQRADGMFGSMIVRSSDDVLSGLYDVDDHAHILLVTDWLDDLAIEKFVYHHHSQHDNKPYNILVNGRGYAKDEFVHEGAHPPLTALTVKQGKRHRMRAISNSIQNCPIEISIDGHNLLLIAKDGAPISPIVVESFVIYGGERWDFVLEANNGLSNYWIKFHGLLDCDDRFKSAFQVALLHYHGAANDLPSPISEMTWEQTKREGFQVNTLNKAPGDSTFKTAAEMSSPPNIPSSEDYSGPPDHSFWLDFDFHASDNDYFHHHKYYPFYGVTHKYRLFMPQINHITLALPSSPPLSQPKDVSPYQFCNSTNPPKENCTKEFCNCMHTLNVRKDSLVEVILIDKGKTYYANHPFHLHGHVFAVVGMGRLGSETSLRAVQELESQGLLQRNTYRPPVMDTVTVPDGGYTVIRFRANNPGYWLFHCHISFHSEVGMGLVFKVGEESMFAPVPRHFPKCGNWLPPRFQDLKTTISKWLQQNGNTDQAVEIQLLPVPTTKQTELEKLEVTYNNSYYEYEQDKLIASNYSTSDNYYSFNSVESSASDIDFSSIPLTVMSAVLFPSICNFMPLGFDIIFDDFFEFL